MGNATEPTPAEVNEARELFARALKLPPALREGIAIDLLESVDEPADEEAEEKAWREELARRIESVQNGTAKTYSVEETMAYLRQALAERESR
jgi:putative addiction module component (TIGR02574 family)